MNFPRPAKTPLDERLYAFPNLSYIHITLKFGRNGNRPVLILMILNEWNKDARGGNAGVVEGVDVVNFAIGIIAIT